MPLGALCERAIQLYTGYSRTRVGFLDATQDGKLKSDLTPCAESTHSIAPSAENTYQVPEQAHPCKVEFTQSVSEPQSRFEDRLLGFRVKLSPKREYGSKRVRCML